MSDFKINSSAQQPQPSTPKRVVAAKDGPPAMAADAANFKSAKVAGNDPLATPHRSIWSRIGMGALWGGVGSAIGGAVGGGGVLALGLLGMGVGFIPGLLIFLGAGGIGLVAGAIYGATLKRPRGDYLNSSAVLQADPKGAQIQSLLDQAHHKKGSEAKADYDRAMALASNGDSAAYVAKHVDYRTTDPMPYFAHAADLSTKLSTTLAIASAVGDLEELQGVDYGTIDTIDRVYTRAASQATPAQARGFAIDAVKQGAYKGAQAAFAKAVSDATDMQPLYDMYYGSSNHLANNANRDGIKMNPDDYPLTPLVEKGLQVAKTRQEALDVEGWAEDANRPDLAKQAAQKADTLA